MRLLLDTHVFLWWLQGHRQLGRRAATLIAHPRSTVFVSAVSVWEVAIKAALGKLTPGNADLAAEIEENGFLELPVRAAHAWRVQRLPRHHDDPFDRLLVAQAQAEELTLVTGDERLAAYDVPRVDAR